MGGPATRADLVGRTQRSEPPRRDTVDTSLLGSLSYCTSSLGKAAVTALSLASRFCSAMRSSVSPLTKARARADITHTRVRTTTSIIVLRIFLAPFYRQRAKSLVKSPCSLPYALSLMPRNPKPARFDIPVDQRCKCVHQENAIADTLRVAT